MNFLLFSSYVSDLQLPLCNECFLLNMFLDHCDPCNPCDHCVYAKQLSASVTRVGSSYSISAFASYHLPFIGGNHSACQMKQVALSGVSYQFMLEGFWTVFQRTEAQLHQESNEEQLMGREVGRVHLRMRFLQRVKNSATFANQLYSYLVEDDSQTSNPPASTT